MRKVSEQERTIGSQQVQITQMKKEHQLLQESAKQNETSSGKLQSVIQILQRKE